MIATANDTLLLNSPVVRGPVVNMTPDRTADLLRIVRHALKAKSAATPLDRAIRSAAGYPRSGSLTDSVGLATEEVDARADLLARRMNTLLTHRGAPAVNHNRETVRA
jgi:hypothetical protein